MLRLRRYRVFLFFAAVFVFLVVRISRKSEWARAEIEQFAPRRPHQEPVREKSIPFTPLPPKVPGLQAQWTPGPQVVRESLVGEGQRAVETRKPVVGSGGEVTKVSKVEEGHGVTTTTPVATEKPKAVSGDAAKGEVVPHVVLPDRDGSKTNANTPPVILPVTAPGVLDEDSIAVEASSTAHWQRQSERYPVPTESLIHLPTGKPVKIPRIQHEFDDETTDAKISREKRQTMVRQEFQRAWKGYKKYAWGHDELSPVSGKFRDPFCGWAATLVDTLDTLWIMGLEDEFEEAVKAVDRIDFTTSPRMDIPMFETTIRYMGGLIAAFDVSGGKYKSLLVKAIELAEVLMGAFDTPNRMPILYYKWAPDFASQPHRASSNSNLAELGSLCMEFTRLAQLTQDTRYYDAVARVTIALEEWQDRGTTLPGVFPENVDASGCNRTVKQEPALSPEIIPFSATSLPKQVIEHEKPEQTAPPSLDTPADSAEVGTQRVPGQPGKSKIKGWEETHAKQDVDPEKLDTQVVPGQATKSKIKGWEETHGKQEVKKSKRELTNQADATLVKRTPPSPPMAPLSGVMSDPTRIQPDEVCQPQGLISTGQDKYSMGGGQDSTYEYFPKVSIQTPYLRNHTNILKQHLLLGGLETVYSKMYNKTMGAIKKHMLYRPMVPDNRDILFTGSLLVYGSLHLDMPPLNHEVEHLTCFIGGMIGMGAKIFEREGDLEMAKRLTDGCVWAYEATASGIMPEGGMLMACDDLEKCTWNQTDYHLKLDPQGPERDAGVLEYKKLKKEREEEEKRAKEEEEQRAKIELQRAEAYNAQLVAKIHAEQEEEAEKTGIPVHTALRRTNASASLQEDAEAFLQKRQNGQAFSDALETSLEKTNPKPASSPKSTTDVELEKKAKQTEDELRSVASSGRQAEKPLLAPKPEPTPEYDPSLPPTHAEYVASRIRQEALPPGYLGIRSRQYILRYVQI